jgi:hypothetical protein
MFANPRIINIGLTLPETEKKKNRSKNYDDLNEVYQLHTGLLVLLFFNESQQRYAFLQNLFILLDSRCCSFYICTKLKPL